jgi:integrase/recombinase XerD
MPLHLLGHTPELIRRSPSRLELMDFADWLATERYSDYCGDQHVKRLVRILPRLSPDGRIRAYSEAQLVRAVEPERSPRSHWFAFSGTRRAYARYLRARGRLRAERAEDRFAALRLDYARFLLEVRGISESSRAHHAHEIADFLHRAVRPRQPLWSLRRDQVEGYIQLRSREVSRLSLQHVVGIVRCFVRYLHLRGHAPAGLDSLDTPRTYRGELPPKAMPWRSVRKLLDSIDPNVGTGLRDLCILHLLAYYGLRPGEVVELRLTSIDWATGVLHVHQLKTRSDLQLPLARQTLGLLRRYLVHCRNLQEGNYEALFLRARCPNGPIQRYTIGDIFYKRAREAGLPDGSHAYQLRHTFAMRLLSRGVGVKAIGDVMGHRSLESTCAYLRLDFKALRSVALPVPSVRGFAQEVRHG